MNRKNIYRLTAVLFLLALCVVQCAGFTVYAQETDAGALQDASGSGIKATGLHNPAVEEDSSMKAKQKATWDCVWFGSYPQAEVGASYMEVYGRLFNGDFSTLEKGDVIIDAELYGRLKAATEWDSNNDIILDGQKYRRMEKKREDALF